VDLRGLCSNPAIAAAVEYAQAVLKDDSTERHTQYTTATRPATTQPHRTLSPSESAALVRAYECGQRVSELASEYEIHRDTAAKIINRAGVPKRLH
jgi:hypothetical protein